MLERNAPHIYLFRFLVVLMIALASSEIAGEPNAPRRGVSQWTEGKSQYCMSADEEGGIFTALQRLAAAGRVDMRRAMVLQQHLWLHRAAERLRGRQCGGARDPEQVGAVAERAAAAALRRTLSSAATDQQHKSLCWENQHPKHMTPLWSAEQVTL